MPGPTSQTTSQVDNQPPTSTLKASRVIPGLTAAPASTTSAAKRSRKKKTASTSAQTKSDQPSTITPATENVENASAPSAPVAVGGLGITLEPPSLTLNSHSTTTPVPSQPVSPVQQVQKRIRAATKKMQRIAGYETSSTPLNEDQKRAIASKPALEATVKELQDLLKILEEDELLDEQRINAVREEEERKVKGRVDAAIAAEQKNADSNLTFLLQFLHLYSLFNAATQAGESFAPVIMAPVLETATAQEVAAINSLFHQLANGPIAGGGGDAFQSIQSLASGAEAEVIPGVPFARIKEMVTQLTAPPATDISNPSSTEKNNLMFLQHSEVAEEPSIAANPAPAHLSVDPSSHSLTSSPNLSVDHVARNKALLETAQIVSADPNQENWNVNSAKEEAPQSSDWSKPTEMLSSDQAEVVARTIDWAEDVVVDADAVADAQVPAPDLTPAPPTFPSRGFRGNGGRGGYRGGPRGGPHHDGYRGGRGSGYRGGPPHRGGPGGYRGGGGGSGGGTWRPGPPDGPGNYRPRPEGDFPNNGYRGRGGPRGGGGGFHNRGPPNPSQSNYRPEPVAGNWN